MGENNKTTLNIFKLALRHMKMALKCIIDFFIEFFTLIYTMTRDSLFPQKVMLENGTVVMPRRTMMPYILITLIILIVISAIVTEFELYVLFSRGNQFFVILNQMFPVKMPYILDWEKMIDINFSNITSFSEFITVWQASYVARILPRLLDTIKMSILGSFIGATVALPIAILASSNINKSGIVIAILRFVLSIIRTIPVLVYALIMVYIFGLGTTAGTAAIALFTFGIISKMLYEYIETVPLGAFEAVESTGANKPKAFMAAMMPQILPMYLSLSLYSFEINVRNAAILGFVGAGGIGYNIQHAIAWRNYGRVGTIILMLLVTVLLIESTSRYVRKKLT